MIILVEELIFPTLTGGGDTRPPLRELVPLATGGAGPVAASTRSQPIITGLRRCWNDLNDGIQGSGQIRTGGSMLWANLRLGLETYRSIPDDSGRRWIGETCVFMSFWKTLGSSWRMLLKVSRMHHHALGPSWTAPGRSCTLWHASGGFQDALGGLRDDLGRLK